MKRKLGAMLLALCLMLSMMPTALAATTVEFDSEDLFIDIGDTQKLNVTVSPEVAPEEITWASTDDRIVTVDDQGNIEGVAGGSAFISAEVDGVKDEILVVVHVPVNYTADTFADLDQEEILANLNKILGPMELDSMTLESKMLPNGQSMMLSKDIINKAIELEYSINATMKDASGKEAYRLCMNVNLDATPNVAAPVDMAVEMYQASEDYTLSRLFKGGKSLVIDAKHQGAYPASTQLYFANELFGNATLSLYHVQGEEVTKVSDVEVYQGVEISVDLSKGGLYVLSELSEEEIKANAEMPADTFDRQDLLNNKEEILRAIEVSDSPIIMIAFDNAIKADVMPADVIEAAMANGKLLAAAMRNQDGTIYMWMFNLYAQESQVKAMDVSLYANFTDVSGDEQMQKLLGKEARAVRVDLAHNGALPKDTMVGFPSLSVFKEGETVYLYELKDGKLLGVDAQGNPAKTVIEGGNAFYETTHCSSYIMTDVAQIANVEEPSAAAPTETGASPATSDEQWPLMGWAVIAMLAMAGATTVAIAKRK